MDGIDLAFVRSGLMVFLLLIVSVALHEWGHAFVAHLLGDDTPSSQGRVTLNPLVHIDLVGTIIFPLVMIVLFRGNFAPYGWGRPVLTNPANFRHRRAYDILATLAGSGANFTLAVLGVLAGAFVVPREPDAAELLKLLTSFVDKSRSEQGCVDYHFHVSLDDPNMFYFYENWTDRAALDVHLNLPYQKEWFGRHDEFLSRKVELRFFTMLSDYDK